VAITASSTSLGIHSSPALESVLVRELLVNFCWRGFLPCIPYSLPLEVGESSRGDVSIEAVGSSGQCSTLHCASKLWRFPLMAM